MTAVTSPPLARTMPRTRARAFHGFPEYRKARAARENATSAHMLCEEGV